ncbi:MAG: hypothetical protein QM786_15685 [Breznakibacter sp.]
MASRYLTLPIEGGKYYHVFKQSSYNGPIFFTEANYQLFLKRFQVVLGNMVDLLAFCLLPDRFHLVFYAREVILIKDEYVDHPGDVGHFISENLRKLFNTYGLAIIKQEAMPQETVLLDQNFFRCGLETDDRIRQTIALVHRYAEQYGQAAALGAFSSYSAILAKGKSVVEKDAVFALFGDKAHFESFDYKGQVLGPDVFPLLGGIE